MNKPGKQLTECQLANRRVSGIKALDTGMGSGFLYRDRVCDRSPPRAGGGRKVRAPQGTVVGNTHPPESLVKTYDLGEDQCNRKNVRPFIAKAMKGAVVKSGKLYGVQGQIGPADSPLGN